MLSLKGKRNPKRLIGGDRLDEAAKRLAALPKLNIDIPQALRAAEVEF